MLPEEVLLQVQEALYEAPFNPSQWDEFLRLAAAATGGEAAALLLRDSGDAQSLVVRHWSMAPKSKRRHQEDYSALNLWVQAVTKASDWLGASRQIVSLAELEQTEFYNDLFSRFEMPNGIFAVVERSPSRLASLSLYRSEEAGPFPEQAFDVVRSLCPHIRRAYRFHLHLAGSRNQRASLRTGLDSLAMGVILLASKGQIVTMNRAAERLLADNDSLEISREGLRARRPEESARLEKLIAQATAASEDEGLPSAGFLTVSSRNRSSLLLLVSPVRGLDVHDVHPVRAIVFLTDPAQRIRPNQSTLRALFGLTPAEYRLAMLLADGEQPTAIGKMIGVSRNTLKSQLSSIYRKTGTSRQAQLVRLLLQLPAVSPIKRDPALQSRDASAQHGASFSLNAGRSSELIGTHARQAR